MPKLSQGPLWLRRFGKLAGGNGSLCGNGNNGSGAKFESQQHHFFCAFLGHDILCGFSATIIVGD